MTRIINEIKATDAYNRFYSDIDIDVFNAATFGSKNLLSISKFILDCIKKDENVDNASIIEKCNAIGDAYKQLGNEKQVEINDKAKRGGYATIDELYNEIINAKESVEHIQGLNYGPNGLIILESNDVYTITSTPTYMSNTKNFGYTKWCTASDIFGRSNGYEYFTTYTLRNPDNEVYPIEMDDYEKIRRNIEACEHYKQCSILVQIKIKDKEDSYGGYYLYQVEVHPDGHYGTMCDMYDEDADFYDVEDHVGEEETKKIKRIISQYCELIMQSVLKYAPSEFEKVQKIENSYRQKAIEDNKSIYRSVPSLIDDIKDFTYRELVSDLSNEYDDEAEDYGWYNNMRYDTNISNNFYDVVSVYLGSGSKKMDDFRIGREIAPKLHLIYERDKFVGYKVSDCKEYYCVRTFDGVPYLTAIDYRGKDGNLKGVENFYDLQGNLLFQKDVQQVSNFNLLLLGDDIINAKENSKDFSNYSKTFDCGGKPMKIYGTARADGYNYTSFDKEVIKVIKTRTRSDEYSGIEIELYFSENQEPVKVRLHELLVQMTNLRQNLQINSNDIEAAVSECIRRIINRIL